MRGLTAVAMAALMLPGAAMASDAGDQLAQRLYAGTLVEARSEGIAACENLETDGCFAVAI